LIIVVNILYLLDSIFIPIFWVFSFFAFLITLLYLKRNNLWIGQLAHFLWETVQYKDIMLYPMSTIFMKCLTILSLTSVFTKVQYIFSVKPR
jgi:hypothetical protein